MSGLIIMIGIALAVLTVVGAFKLHSNQLRMAGVGAAVVILFLTFTLASFRLVGQDSVGVVSKSIGYKSLPAGKIVATEGEKGPQADILPPGWHPWLWPLVYSIENVPVTTIPAGSMGLLTAVDGLPLPGDATFAPEWTPGTEGQMSQDANYFLTTGKGLKGPQTTVLKPGSYRINPHLFKMSIREAILIDKAEVGVIKSNVGVVSQGLAEKGQRGIQKEPLHPGQYYLNPNAYEVTKIKTSRQIMHYTKAGPDTVRAIIVNTKDGFKFPVDVRIQFQILPKNAPTLVMETSGSQEQMEEIINTAVRSTFRNNAQNVKALDYIRDRENQEKTTLEMLRVRLIKAGITVTEVNIGGTGGEGELDALLKTLTDREIAEQQKETYALQQIAAEQEKALERTKQEALEEKKLAIARYQVQIAEQQKEQMIINATAEAEATKLRAEAQAKAYQMIAEQIGQNNAAMVEFLKIAGEHNIQITPRVMVINGEKSKSDGMSTALMGTMLEALDSKVKEKPAAK